jgi:hypothetical protein
VLAIEAGLHSRAACCLLLTGRLPHAWHIPPAHFHILLICRRAFIDGLVTCKTACTTHLGAALLQLLAAAGAAESARAAPHLTGKQPQWAAVHAAAGSTQRHQCRVCLAAVGGPQVGNDLPLHTAGQRVPGAGGAQVCYLTTTFAVADVSWVRIILPAPAAGIA